MYIFSKYIVLGMIHSLTNKGSKEDHIWCLLNIIPDISLFYAVLDLYIAGTDTVATTITWLILYMMKYKEAQDKCQNEIEQVAEFLP